MTTPKMLPWLSNTSGIALERAEELWQAASDYAENLTDESESARYLALAHEHMVALVEQEILSTHPVEDAPWLMIQAHLSVAPMILADVFAQASTITRNALSRLTDKQHTTTV